MVFKLEYCENIRNAVIEPDGWYGPIYITYGFMKWSGDNFLLWQVDGTTHLFRTPLKYVNAKHGSDYDEHFKVTLETFRDDLIYWLQIGLPEDWQQNYYNQFNLLIRY